MQAHEAVAVLWKATRRPQANGGKGCRKTVTAIASQDALKADRWCKHLQSTPPISSSLGPPHSPGPCPPSATNLIRLKPNVL